MAELTNVGLQTQRLCLRQLIYQGPNAVCSGRRHLVLRVLCCQKLGNVRSNKASATRDEDPLWLVGLVLSVLIGHNYHRLQDTLRVPVPRLSSSTLLDRRQGGLAAASLACMTVSQQLTLVESAFLLCGPRNATGAGNSYGLALNGHLASRLIIPGGQWFWAAMHALLGGHTNVLLPHHTCCAVVAVAKP